MDRDQRLARLGGWLFIGTFVTSIVARFFGFQQSGILDPGYVASAGNDALVRFGAFFEFFLIVTNIGTAIAFYPVLRRYSEVGALGYIGGRIAESMFVAIGLIALLAVVLMHNDPAGVGSGALAGPARALVGVYDRAFLMGPGFIVGLNNGLLLGWLMYGSGVMPRRLALIGIIGGPLAFASGVLVLFDVTHAQSSLQTVLTIPEIIWEASVGIYLVWKGWKPSPILRLPESETLQRVPAR
jgi:Domain of unknown function (DUF4386)